MKTQPSLPEMPGPTSDSIERRMMIEKAIEDLHSALLPVLEALPVANGSQPTISYTARIRGDVLTIRLSGGTGE